MHSELAAGQNGSRSEPAMLCATIRAGSANLGERAPMGHPPLGSCAAETIRAWRG